MNVKHSPTARSRTVPVCVCWLITLAVLVFGGPASAEPCTATFQVNLGSGNQSLNSGYIFPIRGSAAISWTPADGCADRTATKIELYKKGSPNVRQWTENISENAFSWDPVTRPSGTGPDQLFFFRVTFDGSGSPTTETSDFYIRIPLTIEHPASGESFDEYGSMDVGWSMEYPNENDRYTVRLLNSGETICRTLWESYDGTSNTWNSVEPCSESAATYYIRVVWINGASKDSVRSDGFIIRPCQVTLSRPTGTPATLALYCQSQLAGQTVFAANLTKANGPAATVASIKVTVATGSTLFGTYKYQVGTGTETSLTINTTGSYTIPINQAINSTPLPVVIKTYSFTNLQDSGTMDIDLVANSDVVFNGSYSECAATGAPISGTLLTWSRKPRPTVSLAAARDSVAIWCDAGSGQNPTICLEPTFGETNGNGFNITGILIEDQHGHNFNNIQEIAVYKGATKYLYATPGTNVTSVNLSSGTDISVGANSSTAYEIRYTWKSTPPGSPILYIPMITDVTTDASTYCLEVGDPTDPFSSIYSDPGRKMLRSPSGGIAAQLNSGNPDDQVYMCSADAAAVLMLKVDLTASNQDMEVDQIALTAEAAGGDTHLFSYFSSVSVKHGNTMYTNNSPGNTNTTTVSTVANGSNPQLVVPAGNAITLEVYLTPKSSLSAERNIRLQMTRPTFSGTFSGLLNPDPCDGDYTYSGSNLNGCYLQLFSTPTLETPVFSDLDDVHTCTASRTDVIAFTLTGATYVNDEPELSTVEYTLDAPGQLSWLSEIRLYKTEADYVVDANKDGFFDNVDAKAWKLSSTASAFRIAVTPVAGTDAQITLRPRLRTVTASDPDGCTIAALAPDHADATLNYKKKATLTVTKSDISTGQRGVCSTTAIEQPMLRVSFHTDAAETAALRSLSLNCLVDGATNWTGVSSVRVYSGGALLNTTGLQTVDFGPTPPTIPSSPGVLELEVRFVFNSNTVMLDKGYKASLTACVAAGTISGGNDFQCGNLSLPAGAPWTEASTLVFRPAGALTVDLTNYPTSWTIPNETQQPQVFAQDEVSANAREDIDLYTLTYTECSEQGYSKPFSSYISTATLYVDNVQVKTGSVGQNIDFDVSSSPIRVPANGNPRHIELRGSFGFNWSDPGNNGGPHVKFSAPTITARGVKSGVDCQSTLQKAYPDGTTPNYGFDLEKRGTVKVATVSSEADTLYCGREELALPFTLRTTAEETGTLTQIVVSFDDFGQCQTFDGTARLVTDTGRSYGPVEISALRATFGGFTNESLTSTARSFEVYVTMEDDVCGASGRSIRPYIASSGVTANGHDTGREMAVEAPAKDLWLRTLTLIQEAATYATILVPGPVAVGPSTTKEIGTLGITALCEDVSGARITIATSPAHQTKVIKWITVKVSGCGLSYQVPFDWYNGEGSTRDVWEQTFDLPTISAGCTLQLTIEIETVSAGDFVNCESTVRTTLSAPLTVPTNVHDFKVYFQTDPFLTQSNCTLIPNHTYGPDDTGNIKILEFALLTSALDPGETITLNELTLDWLVNTTPANQAYTTLTCLVDGEPRAEIPATTSPPKFIFGSGNRPIFGDLESHTFSVHADMKPSGKTGVHQLGIELNPSTVKLSDPNVIVDTTKSCDGATISFENVASVSVCGCDPRSTQPETWSPEEEIPIYTFRLQKSGAGHRVQIDDVRVSLTDPTKGASFTDNCALTAVRVFDVTGAGGCNGSVETDITGRVPEFDPPTGTLSIPLDNYVILENDSSEHYILVKVEGNPEASFWNRDSFRFGNPEASAYDKTIESTAPTQSCTSPPPWPMITPRVKGWVDVATTCVAPASFNPNQWTPFYQLDLTPNKEDLVPALITIPLTGATDIRLADPPDGNNIQVALFDAMSEFLTNVIPMTSTSEVEFRAGDFIGGGGQLALVDGRQTWFLKLMIPENETLSANNESKSIVIDHLSLKDAITFAGNYSGEDLITGRGTPQPCSITFGLAAYVKVTHDPPASRHVQPGLHQVSLYRDIIEPGRPNTNLRIKRFAYGFLEKPTGWNTGAFDFNLHRSEDGSQFTTVTTTREVREDSLVFYVTNPNQGNVPTSGTVVFEVWVDVNACDADEKLQLAVGECGSAYGTCTQAEDQKVACICDEEAPDEGPLITCDPGPCTVNAGRSGFVASPDYVYAGVPFEATISLHDASGVENTGGNPIPGVSKNDFTFDWLYDGVRQALTPEWITGATNGQGLIQCSLTIMDQVAGDVTGEIICTVRGGECEFPATARFRAGEPVDSLSSVSSEMDYNYQVLTVHVRARDGMGNALHPDFFSYQMGTPPNEELSNPAPSAEDPLTWTYDRSKGAANISVPVTIASRESDAIASTIHLPVRVPEYSLPTFISPEDIVVSKSGQAITVTGLFVADSNAVTPDRDHLRAYLLLRRGWTDDMSDTSNVQTNASGQDPRDGIPFLGGTNVVPPGFETTRSIDWRIAALDRDDNVAYYPEEGFQSLIQNIAEAKKNPTPPIQGDWRFFSIPDIFPGNYPGVPEGVFGEMISQYGQPAKDKWAVAEYDGGEGFTYFKKDGEPLLGEILIGRGYWIAGAEQRTPIVLLNNGNTQPTEAEFVVDVRRGDWTFLGNPFNFRLTAEDLKRATIRYPKGGRDVNRRLYDEGQQQYASWFRLLVPFVNTQTGGADFHKYGNVTDGSYQSPDQWTMDAWGASYLYLSPDSLPEQTGIRLIWTPPDAPTHPLGRIEEKSPIVVPRVASPPPSTRWSVRLSATGSQDVRSDPLTIRSFYEGRDELDVYDSPRAPDLGTGARLGLISFPDTDPNSWRIPLEVDTRSASADAQVVSFYLTGHGDISGIARVSWEPAILPHGWSGRIVDEIDRQVVDVAVAGSMEVPLAAPDTYVLLRLVLAPEGQLDQTLANVLQPSPETLELLPPTPNPCTVMTRIRFALPETSPIKLQVYDVQGRKVRTLFDGRPAGVGLQTILWDARDDAGKQAAAGVYWIRLEADGKARRSTVVVLR